LSKKNIVWLASYPKSGNTWLRAFLTAIYNPDLTLDINKLWINLNFASRQIFEGYTNLNSYELDITTIDNLKPEVYSQLSQKHQDDRIYIKIHEHLHHNTEGKPIIPIDDTYKVIYLIRNPLDIIVSFAHHTNYTIDKVLKIMCSDYNLGGSIEDFAIPSMLHESLSDWSTHVKSWVDNPELDVVVVRYEDLLSNKKSSFARIIKELGIERTNSQLERAIEASSFENLQNQEKKNKFVEKNPKSDMFFRSGRVGDWQRHLSRDQINDFLTFHHEVMLRFGYK